MTKKFKDIKCGEFFFMEGNEMGVKVNNVIPEKELYWSCDDFNAVVMSSNGCYYREWIEDDEEFAIPTAQEIVDFMEQKPPPFGAKILHPQSKKVKYKFKKSCTNNSPKFCAICTCI